jgi:hypothetical protein
MPRPSRFTQGKTRYPLYRSLGGPQGQSGQVQKISPPPGFDPWTVQLIASRYTDWAIPAHLAEFVPGANSYGRLQVVIFYAQDGRVLVIWDGNLWIPEVVSGRLLLILASFGPSCHLLSVVCYLTEICTFEIWCMSISQLILHVEYQIYLCRAIRELLVQQ